MVNKPQLLTRLRSEIQKDLEDGFNIEEKYINYEIAKVAENKNNIVLGIKTDATASKTVETSDILGISTGKNVSSLEKKLITDFEIEKVDFEHPFGGRLPFLSFWSPFFGKNITISTTVR